MFNKATFLKKLNIQTCGPRFLGNPMLLPLEGCREGGRE
jgi:hypothetical protein